MRPFPEEGAPMRAMRTRIARTVAALATAALVAAACGGGEELDEGTGTTETSAGAAPVPLAHFSGRPALPVLS